MTFGGDPVTLGMSSRGDVERVDAEVERWWTQHAAAGRIVCAVRLKPPLTATTLRFGTHPPLVCDSPCTPETEAIEGYTVIDVNDLDQALALVRGWPGRGYVEIRPVMTWRSGDER